MPAETTVSQEKSAMRQVKEGVQHAASATADFAGQVVDKAKDYASLTTEKTTEAVDQMGDAIKKYPITIALSAFAIGFLTGRLCRE